MAAAFMTANVQTLVTFRPYTIVLVFLGLFMPSRNILTREVGWRPSQNNVHAVPPIAPTRNDPLP